MDIIRLKTKKLFRLMSLSKSDAEMYADGHVTCKKFRKDIFKRNSKKGNGIMDVCFILYRLFR